MAFLSFKLDKLFIFHIPLLITFRHGLPKKNWVDDVFGGSNNNKKKVTDEFLSPACWRETQKLLRSMQIAFWSMEFSSRDLSAGENENPFWPFGDIEEDGTLA
jgi:hypothetical protein